MKAGEKLVVKELCSGVAVGLKHGHDTSLRLRRRDLRCVQSGFHLLGVVGVVVHHHHSVALAKNLEASLDAFKLRQG